MIFLGDYIDRGPDSRQVLQIVQRLQAQGAICLRGNHEELMLGATELERGLTNFLVNGGDATIASLRTPAAFQRAQEWMRGLPTNHEDERRYYVHAGIRPGVPLDQQTAETKLWIRDSFLRHTGRFPKYIVHGHSADDLFRSATNDAGRARQPLQRRYGRWNQWVSFGRDFQRPPNEADPHDQRWRGELNLDPSLRSPQRAKRFSRARLMTDIDPKPPSVNPCHRLPNLLRVHRSAKHGTRIRKTPRSPAVDPRRMC